MRDRVDEIPLLVNVLEKLGVTELNVKNILEGDETQGERVTAEEKQRILQYRAQAEKQGVHLSYAEMPERNFNTRETRTCVDPWRMAYVNATGWINPCCFSFGDKSAYFGNVLQEDFTKIWNNKAYQEFRRDLKTGMPGVCKECPKHGAKWIGEGSLM
jgi:radical SAM protein with 4Fe4S-binding SPASM domain